MPSPLAIAINQFRPGGGMESYTLDLVQQLAARGHPVTVYAARAEAGLAEAAGARLISVPQSRIPKKLRPFLFARQLDRLRVPGEILIACNPSDHADLFVCGGTHLGYLQAMGERAGLIDLLTIRRNRSNYRTARRIMAHSERMRQELTTLYQVPSEKIRVVHPGADTQRFTPADRDTVAALRERFGFAPHETVFLFPSTGHRRKGLEQLAAFFEHTQLPVKLAVAGSPLPRPMKNTVGLGFCRDMPDLYRAADYTVMASRYEPFGLVGIESVLCGTPVVLADNMGCTEVIRPEAGLFFPRHDSAALAAALTAAHQRAQSGRHKLADPAAALSYNPSPAHHTDCLLEMLP